MKLTNKSTIWQEATGVWSAASHQGVRTRQLINSFCLQVGQRHRYPPPHRPISPQASSKRGNPRPFRQTRANSRFQVAYYFRRSQGSHWRGDYQSLWKRQRQAKTHKLSLANTGVRYCKSKSNQGSRKINERWNDFWNYRKLFFFLAFCLWHAQASQALHVEQLPPVGRPRHRPCARGLQQRKRTGIFNYIYWRRNKKNIYSIKLYIFYFISLLPYKLLVTFKLFIAGTSTVGCEGRSKRRCSTRVENSIRHSIPETTGNINSLVWNWKFRLGAQLSGKNRMRRNMGKNLPSMLRFLTFLIDYFSWTFYLNKYYICLHIILDFKHTLAY